MGRPTVYNEQLADIISDLIRVGKTLNEICSLDSMPCVATLYTWRDMYPDFLEKCQKAEDDSADALYLRGLTEILNTPRVRAWEDENGKLYSDEEVKILSKEDKDLLGLTKVGLSSELVSRNKAIYDACKHFAAIRNPEKYSEKRQLKISMAKEEKDFLDTLEVIGEGE